MILGTQLFWNLDIIYRIKSRECRCIYLVLISITFHYVHNIGALAKYDSQYRQRKKYEWLGTKSGLMRHDNSAGVTDRACLYVRGERYVSARVEASGLQAQGARSDILRMRDHPHACTMRLHYAPFNFQLSFSLQPSPLFRTPAHP